MNGLVQIISNMKKIWLCIIVFILCILNVNAEDKVTVYFSKCVDGDTALLNINGKDEKFRFLAIDTPESVHPTKKTEAFGKEASEYTCNMLKNAKVLQVEFDSKSDKTDKYGRYLVWIYADGQMIQKQLLQNGLAKVAYIYNDYDYVDELYQIQNEASLNKVGIWSNNKNLYTVTFKSYKSTKKVAVTANSKIKEITANKKDGYIFKYWTLNGKEYNFDNPVNKNIVLTAKYEKINLINFLKNKKYGVIILIIILGILLIKSPKKFKRMLKKL